MLTGRGILCADFYSIVFTRSAHLLESQDIFIGLKEELRILKHRLLIVETYLIICSSILSDDLSHNRQAKIYDGS